MARRYGGENGWSGEPNPMFSVSADSKEVSNSASPLFATLAGDCVSVAFKGVRERVVRRSWPKIRFFGSGVRTE